MSFSKKEKDFLGLATANVIVPFNSSKSLSEAFQDEDGEIVLQAIKQRDILFFDERLIVFVVLHIPQCSEEELKPYLARLNLKLEVWASNEAQQLERSPSNVPHTRELLLYEPVQKNEDPIVLVSENDEDGSIFLSLVWEVPITLNRPRARMQDAYTEFVPIAKVSPPEEEKVHQTYLEPFQPQVGNLFEPLKGSRGYEDGVPYLPISRLHSVLPLPPKDDHTFHIQVVPSPPISTHSAFVTRLKYSKSNINNNTNMALTASVDIELIPYVEVQGQINVVDVKLQKGRAMALMDDMLPMDCQSGDFMTFLYQLERSNDIETDFQGGKSNHADILDVIIEVKLRICEDCFPVIQMNWTTDVDFSHFSNTPNIHGSISHKAGTLLEGSNGGVPQDPAHQNGTNSQSAANSAEIKAVSISFTAPRKTPSVGVPFSWQVLIVNRTTKPAKLAIIPLPRVQKPVSQAQQYTKRHATRSSTASFTPSERYVNDKGQSDVAQAVIDENVIYAMQHSGTLPPETDIMSLTPELRVGPLGPGQCHEGEIKFVAFKSGAFTIDVVRVIDLMKEVEQGYGGPGVIMDIRELPDVIIKDDTE